MSYRSGPLNLLTDVAGLAVGNAADARLKSGVTVVLCEAPSIAAVQVLGGAPGTRETDLLEPHNAVDTVDALVLSGGSAFGLDAASGVQAALRERGVGFGFGGVRVPIVPAAILFDLINGGDKDWGRYPPYRELGYAAVQAASRQFAIGSEGAGAGALAAGLKGGLGSASTSLEGGITVGALVAANPTGSVTVADSRISGRRLSRSARSSAGSACRTLSRRRRSGEPSNIPATRPPAATPRWPSSPPTPF